ncbi:hypothetical protein BH23PLA1_BH23PLA1_24580 [soil metagenome]
MGRKKPNQESEGGVPLASESPLRPILYQGAQRDIVCAVKTDGTSPAKHYIDALSESDQAKFSSLFVWMGDLGMLRNKEKFRAIGDVKCSITESISKISLFEFKIHGERIVTFQSGRRWVLTHGFSKKGAVLKTERERAKQIIEEDLSQRG